MPLVSVNSIGEGSRLLTLHADLHVPRLIHLQLNPSDLDDLQGAKFQRV